MNTITHSQRYLPHEINTKFYAVKLYRSGVGVSFVCRRYHISKSSLLRWNKKFDGTKESLDWMRSDLEKKSTEEFWDNKRRLRNRYLYVDKKIEEAKLKPCGNKKKIELIEEERKQACDNYNKYMENNASNKLP